MTRYNARLVGEDVAALPTEKKVQFRRAADCDGPALHVLNHEVV
jgi:hypothetical protein